MKYKTFRNIAVTVAALGALAGLGTCTKCAMDASARRKEEDRVAAVERAKADELLAAAAARERAEAVKRDEELLALQAKEQAAARANPAAFVADAPGLSPSDRDVLTALQRPVTDKVKDATAGKPWKVNIYADDKVRFNRAKVDLDRDGKWDESWTIKADASVEKKTAPADDEKYTSTRRLDKRSGWLSLDAPPPPPPAATPTTPTPTSAAAEGGLSSSDREVLALVKRLPPEEKIKDATKGKPFKVNLYSDDRARWNRAKVDLDRDDKWDESWTFKDGATEKKTAPNDDETYTQVLELAGERWTVKSP